MPHVSRRKLEGDTQKLIDSALVWTFSRLKGNEVNIIFNCLLTPTERLMLAKRLGMLYLLKEDKEESVIAETLKTTHQTVYRIKLQHQLTSAEESKFIFKKLTNWEEFTVFKNAMQKLALYALKTFSRGMAGKI